MSSKFSDKNVVITGCSSGIGLCSALTLAERGYKVIATVRNEKDAEPFERFQNVSVVLMELADSESVQQAAKKIIALSEGKLYAVFNNAAYGQPGAVEDLTRDALRKNFEVNVFGTHEFTRCLLPLLLKQERAHIIQNSSILGFIGIPMRGAYVATKFALEGLSDTLRMELSDTYVQVSIIEPGPIVSAFRKNALIALQENIDYSNSRHGWRYVAAEMRLAAEGPVQKYTLGPEAVVARLIHVLESKRPKFRYPVTLPTYMMAFLTRILPIWLLDKMILSTAKNE